MTVRHDFTFFSELDGIAQEIDQDLPQTSHIAFDARGHIVIHDVGDVESFFDGAASREVQCGFDAFTQVKGLVFHIHLARFDLAEVEDVIDDGEQCIARVADGLSVVALFLVQFGIHQKTAHSNDRVHRCADLVTDRGQEGTLGFVGLFCGSAGLLGFIEEALSLVKEARVFEGDT